MEQPSSRRGSKTVDGAAGAEQGRRSPSLDQGRRSPSMNQGGRRTPSMDQGGRRSPSVDQGGRRSPSVMDPGGRRSPSVMDPGAVERRGSQPNSRKGSLNPPMNPPFENVERRGSNNSNVQQPVDMQGGGGAEPPLGGFEEVRRNSNRVESRRGSNNPNPQQMDMQGGGPGLGPDAGMPNQAFDGGERRASQGVNNQAFDGGERRASNIPAAQGDAPAGSRRGSQNMPQDGNEIRRGSRAASPAPGHQGDVRRASNQPTGDGMPPGSRRGSSHPQDAPPPLGLAGDAPVVAGSRRGSSNPQMAGQDMPQQQRGSVHGGEAGGGGSRRSSNTGKRADLTLEVPPSNEGQGAGGGSRKGSTLEQRSRSPSRATGGPAQPGSRKGSHQGTDSMGPPTSPLITKEQVLPDSPQMRQAGFDSAVTVKQYLNATIVPILREALRALVKSRPADPYEFVGRYILENKPR